MMADSALKLNRSVLIFIRSVCFLSAVLFGSLVVAGILVGTDYSFGSGAQAVLQSYAPRKLGLEHLEDAVLQIAFINVTIAIFTAPTRPFRLLTSTVDGQLQLDADVDDPQYQSVRSWLDLVPQARVILLGNDPSFHIVAQRLSVDGKQVKVEPNIDHNFRGTPQVHSIFARADVEANSDVLMFVRTGVRLQQKNTLIALQKTVEAHENWLLISRINNSSAGVELWAWNRRKRIGNETSLHLTASPIPPFSHVLGTYENWILGHLINPGSNYSADQPRVLVDATDARIISTFSNINDDTSSGSRFASSEAYINSILSSTIDPKHSSVSGIRLKLIVCNEPKVYNLCMVDIPEEAVSSPNSRQEEFVGGGMPQVRLEELLPLVADENKLVVMVGGTSNYKEMLMSFICNVKALGVKEVLVAAFDEDLFEYAYTQGLAVYYEHYAEDYRAPITGDRQCEFNSECFIHVSKLKSWSVLRVLKRGYHVLWTDMDIVWFKNPIQELLALGTGTLAIQSDELDPNVAANNIRGANSGFYLARAEDKTIRAFKAIVGLAMTTDLTEQPSFYDVLCGVTGQNRVGDDECNYEGLKVILLSRDVYPNGAVFGLWDSPEGPAESCRRKGCVLLHNNYIAGKQNKLMRVVTHGMWFYDVERRMCLQPWHPLSLSTVSLTEFQAHFLHVLNLS